MSVRSSKKNTKVPSSFRPPFNPHTPLDKIFRLYSPNNYIPTRNPNANLPKKENQKAVIQLIFPHPNLLFIHPQNVKDPAEKQAFLELNMMKSIIERKQLKTANGSSSPKNFANLKTKPMTAPNLRRQKEKTMGLMTIQKSDNEDSVNVCTLVCEDNNKQRSSQESYSSGTSWRKSKTFTSKSQFRKANIKEKENEEGKMEREFRNKVLNKNTFDFLLEEKKKILGEKYNIDKMLRDDFYKKSLKSPQTQMYIDIEGKFLKYFRNK